MVYIHEPLFAEKMYSHVYADSEEELFEVIELLGLKREWVRPGDRPHFEIYSTKLRLALKHDRIQYLTLSELEEYLDPKSDKYTSGGNHGREA